MATIKCAISGLDIKVSHGPFILDAKEGYYHPIFALPYKRLYGLYSKHIAGELTETDSYLLFLAFLHSTDQIEWNHPATRNPRDKTTIALVENNMQRLIQTIEKTNIIRHPSFKQPSFAVYKDNSSLLQIPRWIDAWNNNLNEFYLGEIAARDRENLVKVENKLQWWIKSQYTPERYIAYIARWASLAGEFPDSKKEAYMKTIRLSFSESKTFYNDIPALKEVLTYCENNIEQGSIYSYSLFSTLRTAIAKRSDFLGLTNGYTLLPVDTTKNDIEVEVIKSKATLEPPVRTDYSSDIEFTKAKLRYRVALISAKKDAVKKPTPQISTPLVEPIEPTETLYNKPETNL